MRGHEAFEPEWIRGTFTVRGECENPSCKQLIHGAGDYYVDMAVASDSDDPWGDRGPTYSSFYQLGHLYPPLHLMPVPRSAPEELQVGIRRASRVLFADPGLAATALRAVVERFLTVEGISSTSPSGRFRSAQERITEWSQAGPGRAKEAGLFSAVKWLGNAGTHEDSDLTMMEVLDGASLLDEAFHRVYTGPNIDAQAQTINTAKGPNRSP